MENKVNIITTTTEFLLVNSYFNKNKGKTINLNNLLYYIPS